MQSITPSETIISPETPRIVYWTTGDGGSSKLFTQKQPGERIPRKTDEAFFIGNTTEDNLYPNPCILADGHGSIKGCIDDVNKSIEIFSDLLCPKIPYSHSQLLSAIETYKKLIYKYTSTKEGKRANMLDCTISFVVPYTDEQGRIKLVAYTRGDSPVFGLNKYGALKQLTLNAHSLFENLFKRKEGDAEVFDFAIKIQEFVTNAITNRKNDNFDRIYNDIFTSLTKQFNSTQLDKLVKIFLEQTLETIEGKVHGVDETKLDHNKKQLFDALNEVISSKSLKSFIKVYYLTINECKGYDSITLIDPKKYSKILICTDGVSENVPDDIIAKILHDPILTDSQRAPEIIKECKEGPKKDDMTVLIMNLGNQNAELN